MYFNNKRATLKIIIFLVVSIVFTDDVFAQNDTIQLNTNEVITGELKDMKQNVATFETDYSDSDFKIKWSRVKRLKTTTQYLISLSSGARYNGYLQSLSDDHVHIMNENDTLAESLISDIVFLRKIDRDFWGNVNASLSVGYNFTKANDLSQFSIRSNLGYRAKRWSASTRYNQIISSQSEADRTQRLDANIVFNKYFSKNWFALAEVNWLSNTAQNINLRTLGKLGIGNYIVQTNSMYWGMQTGISLNSERFNVENLDTSNTSAEAFLGTEANLYDIGDLTLLSRIVVYPSITESSRWRTDFNLDVKYDLPFDFFINLGVSLNYDNQPVQSSAQTDYVFQTTIGWSL